MEAIKKPTVNIFWFRRDLRLEDNHGLWNALKSGKEVLPIFIFDRLILDKLSDKYDKRVQFIHETIKKMDTELQNMGSALEVMYSTPLETFKYLTQKYDIGQVFTNHGYGQYGIERDALVNDYLSSKNIPFNTYKDHVIFEKKEITKDDGNPYTVFTPYSKKWKATLSQEHLKQFSFTGKDIPFFKQPPLSIPTLESMGFHQIASFQAPTKEIDTCTVKDYANRRDYPAQNGTTRMGIHLRFGTVSIRQLVSETKSQSESYLNELIWRDFYHQIVWNFPNVRLGKSFKPLYDEIKWLNNEDDFKNWCQGTTGYPLVDAGMRELNATGYMHNRVRMVVASFLTKHLLIDWRWGEAYFAEKLLDFDFAANNGGWQWASGSGCDAAPYFRVFNPTLQADKFDAKQQYIKKWLPEFGTKNYPKPIVNHEMARKRALDTYAKALKATENKEIPKLFQ